LLLFFYSIDKEAFHEKLLHWSKLIKELYTYYREVHLAKKDLPEADPKKEQIHYKTPRLLANYLCRSVYLEGQRYGQKRVPCVIASSGSQR
jgi:hypothetical protein